MTKYKVNPYGKHRHHIVMFDSSNNTDPIVRCSCKNFEFAGILCAHALKFFSIKDITCITTKYILKRWTKVVKVKRNTISNEKIIEEDPKIEI